MQLRVGYELIYDCPQPTPMMLMLNIHHSRASDIVVPDVLTTTPAVPLDVLPRCIRQLVHPNRRAAGTDPPDRQRDRQRHGYSRAASRASERQHAVEELPEECLLFLLGSRYCETDRLSDTAWSLFGKAPTGALRVQAICDYVHNHITFGYQNARSTKSAWEVYGERAGVCRDFAHLAITFCRCMNIPARYCTGYLGDVGIPPPYGPMDFAAWFEAYVDGQWHTFDPRNNVPRIGRILMARGRDATDVATQHRVRSQHAGRLQGLDGRNRRSAHLVTADMRTAHGAACHGLSLLGTGQTRRASHDVPPARESRPAAGAHQARHPTLSRRPALAARRLRQLDRHRHVSRHRPSNCASTAPSRSNIIETALPDYALEVEAQTYPFGMRPTTRPIWPER